MPRITILTFDGKPCRKCGGTLRFVRGDRKCVPCKRARAREFQERNYTRYGSHLYKQLGISIAEYFAMAEAQGWACKICGKTPKSKLHLDHCHATLRIRGLLCGTCNKGLGQFKDRADLLDAAAEYLRAC